VAATATQRAAKADRKAQEAVRQVHAELEQRTGVSIPVRLWDGTELGNGTAGFRIVLECPWSLRALLRPPFDLAAGEAYVEGAIDLEGDTIAAMALGERISARTHGTTDLLHILARLRALPRPPHRRHARRAALHGRKHSKARDAQAIAFHYDLPQAFYEQFLDRNLVYSCAYFAERDESLERAQERKFDLVCRKLRLRPGMRLLDIGCGWGSLLAHAARHYGVRGVGVTLSDTQVQAGRERLALQGLAGQVEIRLQDYRDLDERFDAIASIGMAEHVGPDHLSAYIRAVWKLLTEGGLFLNHCIVLGDANRVRSERKRTFMDAYVFPDGGLVPAWRMVREVERGGFEVLDVEQLRAHYALTLRSWLSNLEAHHDQAVAAASEADYRIWRVYMAGAAYNFESRRLGVVQVLGHKPGHGHRSTGASHDDRSADADAAPTDPPLGRSWMLP
jgi:cyclopropane-fatty-acyl-phospholipid synthase